MDQEEISALIEETESSVKDLEGRVSFIENNYFNSDPNISPETSNNLKQFVQANVPPQTPVTGRSHKTSTQTIGDSSTKVAWEVNDYASGVTWTAATNRFVIVTAGKYLISACITYGNPVDGSFYRISIRVNNNEVSGHNAHAGASGVALSTMVFDTQNLAIGDYVEIFASHTTGADRDISATAESSYFNIAKIN